MKIQIICKRCKKPFLDHACNHRIYCSYKCYYLNKGKQMIGNKNQLWKGNNASYVAKHMWVKRQRGKATHCSFNLQHKNKYYQWANVSGSYLRDTNDWIQLCIKCHKAYDIIRRGYTTNSKIGIRLVYQ